MSKAVLLGLCVLFSLAARAQSAPAAAPPVRTELSAGRRDTLYALGNLYARRRRGGLVWMGIGSSAVATIIRGLAGGSNTSDAGGVVVSLAVLGGIPASIGVGKLVRFSGDRENEADRAYRSGQPLPRRLARRLRKKDFQ